MQSSVFLQFLVPQKFLSGAPGSLKHPWFFPTQSLCVLQLALRRYGSVENWPKNVDSINLIIINYILYQPFQYSGKNIVLLTWNGARNS